MNRDWNGLAILRNAFLALSLVVLATPASAAVTVGQVDTFDGMSRDFWERGDNVDQRLQLTADGNGANGRLVTFNVIQWSGDYRSAGVDSIRFSMENLGSQEPLVVRIAFGDAINPGTPGSTWYCSLEGIELPVGQSATAAFAIDGLAFTRVQGAASFASVMSDVHAMRILHNPVPDARGSIVIGIMAVDDIEAVGLTTTATPMAAAHTMLSPAYPNPFNPQTTLGFRLAASLPVELVVSDLRGRHVRTLVRGELPAGDHNVVWDGTDDAGRQLGSGVYLARLRAGGVMQMQRLALLK